MGKRFLVLVAICVVALLATGSALAGERTGTGKVTAAPANSGSICAFSGLEDFETPFDETAPVQPGVVQHPTPGDLHGGDNACKGYASGGGH